MSKSTFAGLPVELLKQIRTNLHSLKDVVAFSQINRATALLCDEQYWHNALTASGFGRPTQSLTPLPATWAALTRVICADSKRFTIYDSKFGGDTWITETSEECQYVRWLS